MKKPNSQHSEYIHHVPDDKEIYPVITKSKALDQFLYKAKPLSFTLKKAA